MSVRRTRRLKAEINVVPYIDVMLVLLVIFMVTAPLVQPVEITLPSVGKGTQPVAKPLEVRVDAQGALQWRDLATSARFTPGNEAALLEAVKSAQARDPRKPVVIAADKAVRYERVLRVMDLLQRENVAHVGLLAQPLPAASAR
ncbi:MAG: ExbD/TolR family protein [Rhodocyclaceae bacterium]|nr:ExbD/TolR family protein [Rhodocyclaceae bacterium]